MGRLAEPLTAPPVGEPLCRCGHAQIGHKHDGTVCYELNYGSGCEIHACSCRAFTPAPLSSPRRTRPPRPPACKKCDAPWTPGHVCESPRRTRDEGAEAEAEEAAWIAYLDGDADDGYHDADKPVFLAGYRQSLIDAADAIQALHPGEVKNSVIWLRDRAGRLAGEDDR